MSWHPWRLRLALWRSLVVTAFMWGVFGWAFPSDTAAGASWIAWRIGRLVNRSRLAWSVSRTAHGFGLRGFRLRSSVSAGPRRVQIVAWGLGRLRHRWRTRRRPWWSPRGPRW